ncbi:ribosome assembly RNA-binding protein YhbY [Paenibacillus pasadenensis]|nr:ribosome assembly RNA-binding protein YhbY [Paenibacillus pasadenensis]
MTLTGKQKRHLRALAHHLTPIFQIGKGGYNEQLVKHIEEAIEKRELLKVNLLNNCDEDPREVGAQLASGSGSHLVQVIGKTIVLYKESKDYKTIELPR